MRPDIQADDVTSHDVTPNPLVTILDNTQKLFFFGMPSRQAMLIAAQIECKNPLSPRKQVTPLNRFKTKIKSTFKKLGLIQARRQSVSKPTAAEL